MRRLLSMIAAGVVIVVESGGCSGRPARVVAPRIDPAAITAAVFDKADSDGDGRLVGSELATVPAIAAAASHLDSDGDKAVSREELLGWLTAVRDSRVAITAFETLVTQRGKPLVGATVRFVPEAFMGPGVRSAEGVTGDDGAAVVTIPDAKYPGVNCGFYRVEITGTGNDGRPLPARVNTDTTLGLAVGGGVPEMGFVQIAVD